MTIILDNADLHNAINRYIKDNFGANLTLQSFRISNGRRDSKGEQKVVAEITNNTNNTNNEGDK